MVPALLALSLAAFAGESSKAVIRMDGEKASAAQAKEQAFSFWLTQTAEAARIERSLVVFLREPKLDWKLRLLHLAREIGERDSSLRRYLWRLEELQDKNGRLNPYDKELLSRLLGEAQSKRELADELEKAQKRAGLPKLSERQMWRSALAEVPAAPAAGDLRYDAETGAWERFSSDKGWQAAAAPAP